MDNKLSELKAAAEKYSLTLNAHKENPKDADAVVAWDEATWEMSRLINNDEVNIIVALLAELEAKDKRIAELELDELAMRASSRAVHEAQENHINQQQDRIDSLEKTNAGLGRGLAAAEKRLATPVRLPVPYSENPWMSPDPDGTWFDKGDVKESIRAAGFTVEGDE